MSDEQERAYHTNVWAQEVRWRVVDAVMAKRPASSLKEILAEAEVVSRWVMTGEVAR